jgi:hypothetical protein
LIPSEEIAESVAVSPGIARVLLKRRAAIASERFFIETIVMGRV